MPYPLLSLVDVWWSLVMLLAIVGLYLLPTIIAFDRKVVNKWSVAVINILLGWTLVGWAVALAFAVRDSTNKQPAKG